MREVLDLARGRQLELRAQFLLERAVPGRIEAAQVVEVLRERERARQLLAFRDVTDALRNPAAPMRLDGVPSTVMSPRSGRRMFMSRRMVVVLPAPLGPISANTEPSGTLQVQVFDGLETSKRLARRRVSMTAHHSPDTTLRPRSSVQVSSTACCTS